MQSSSSKSNRKRQREQGNQPCPQRRSQRLLDKSKPTTKITGLNDDCLLKIFAHLNRISLINVAVANEWLRPAANVMYKRKFGNEKVLIGSYYWLPAIYPPDSFFLDDLKECLQFLRCLGSSINGLTIRYGGWNQKQREYIHQYVNEYCAENLVEIGFGGRLETPSIKQFEKPFANVRTVKVSNSDLHNLWTSFAEWFPNMRSLKMKGVFTFASLIDLSKFDHLEEVSIDVHVEGNERNFTANEATRLLQQLPQLQRLDISARGMTLNPLLRIIENNRDIRYLKVDLNQYYGAAATVADIQQLINDHPVLIELELMGLRFTLDTLIPIIPLISQLNALKLFRFQISHRSAYDALVAQLDGQWRSSCSQIKNYVYVVQLEQ